MEEVLERARDEGSNASMYGTRQVVASRLKELALPGNVLLAVAEQLKESDPVLAQVIVNQVNAMGKTLNDLLDDINLLQASVEVKYAKKH